MKKVYISIILLALCICCFACSPQQGITVSGYTTGALAVKDVANGAINGVIIDKQPALMIAETINMNGTKVKVIDIELTLESYAFIVKKGNIELQEQANELLQELKDSGEIVSIISSFFDGTATFIHENPSSKEGCLVVATNAYFPPFEYYEGNKLTGIDIQIASLLAQKLGKSLYVEDLDFDAVFTSVSQGLVDIGMAGITKNEEREKTFDFSIDYYESAQVLIVKADDATFDDCKSVEDIEGIFKTQNKSFIIGAQSGTTGYMYANGDEDFGYEGFTK